MTFRPRHRLLFLGIVNGLILLHILAYYVFDSKEIGCIDFFGLATFAGKGQITAGTVFLGALIILTLLLGRIFCGWGCHFALFQDLLARLLQRLGFQTHFRRSRIELVVPPILLFVTLAYPILAWWDTHGIPQTVTVDLAYPEVWHLLPGIKGVLLMLFVDVVVLTLLFGGRAFCRYICPYGLLLKCFHVLSPTRIVENGDCSGCGSCATACPTGVPIQYEIERFGVIRDLNCMNCTDCISACPSGALALRPTRKAYERGFEQTAMRSGQPFWAEALLLAAAVAGLLLYRGREYGDFLAVGMGLVMGATTVVAVRPERLVPVRITSRLSRRFVRTGAFVLAAFLLLGLVGQGVGLYTLRRGARALENGDYQVLLDSYVRGALGARVLRPFTYYLDDFGDRATSRVPAIEAEGDRLLVAGAWAEAALVYRAVVAIKPGLVRVYGNLGTALLKQGRFWEAARCYLEVLSYDPNDLVALYHLAITRIQLRQHTEAITLVHQILSIDTVGNAYELIRENPLFLLLEAYPEYRGAIADYAMTKLPTRRTTQGRIP